MKGNAKTTLAVLAGLSVLGFATREMRVAAFEHHQAAETYEDVYYLPPPEWLPVMSFGYRSAAADLLWCKSLIYFGDEFVRGGAVKYLFAYADALVALDPDFQAPYRWASIIALYRGGEFDLASAQRATDYLRMAVKRWPEDGPLAWDLGSNLRYEIIPNVKDPAARRKLEEEAAQYMTTAALLGAGPPWLALNSSALLEKLGKKEQAVRHLEEVYGTVQDEETKQQIAAQLAKLRSETYAEAIREATEQDEAARRRSFPYLPASTFFVLGEKASVTRAELLERDFLPEDSSDQVLGQ